MLYPSVGDDKLTESFDLQVSRGLVAGHSTVIVFGYNADVDTSEEQIWPDGGLVPHPASAVTLSVSSTSTEDTAAGTGARTVYLEGLDNSFAAVSETVTLNGQTAVDTANQYRAVNRFTVLTVGSTGHNIGVINAGTGTVTAGTPAVLHDLMAATYNNRTTASYSVPAGYTGYMRRGLFTAGQTSGSSGVTGKLLVTDVAGVTRVGAVVALNNGSAQYDFDPPLQIAEGNRIAATASGAAPNNAVSTMFVITLIQNEP